VLLLDQAELLHLLDALFSLCNLYLSLLQSSIAGLQRSDDMHAAKGHHPMLLCCAALASGGGGGKAPLIHWRRAFRYAD